MNSAGDHSIIFLYRFNVQIWVGGFEEAGCLDFWQGNNPHTKKSYDYSEVYGFLFSGHECSDLG